MGRGRAVGGGETEHALAADVQRLIRGWDPRTAEDRGSHVSFASHLLNEEPPLWRESAPDHVTASGFVMDPTLTRTLFVFHRKGGFWVQPGGHVEPGDWSAADGARREVREETGIVVGDVLAYDLDHHALSSRFGRCASHLDFGFVFLADPADELVVSHESEDLRWWDLAALPDVMAAGVERRLRGVLERVGDAS